MLKSSFTQRGSIAQEELSMKHFRILDITFWRRATLHNTGAQWGCLGEGPKYKGLPDVCVVGDIF